MTGATVGGSPDGPINRRDEAESSAVVIPKRRHHGSPIGTILESRGIVRVYGQDWGVHEGGERRVDRG